MHHIIQLSDIHIGGEYGGKFDCWGNLEAVVNHISSKISVINRIFGIAPLILVTGDVCEGSAATVENYTKVHDLISKIGGTGNIRYTVGNHDDAKIMGEALGFNPDKVNVELLSAYDDPYILIHIPTYTGTVDVDSVMMQIHHELAQLGSAAKDIPKYVYSHFPIGYVDHRFMNNGHALEHGELLHECLQHVGVKEIFCGHYHSGSITPHLSSPCINVCPGIQAQLDPYSKDCMPTGDYPGYADIKIYKDYADVSFKYIEVNK